MSRMTRLPIASHNQTVTLFPVISCMQLPVKSLSNRNYSLYYFQKNNLTYALSKMIFKKQLQEIQCN